MLASGLHVLTLFGIAFGILVLLLVVLSRLRARTVAKGFLLLLATTLVGVAWLMFAPARRGGPDVRPLPAIPRVPEAEFPLAALETDPFDFDQHIETIKEHGDRAAEIARIQFQRGAEAVNEAARQVAQQTREFTVQHSIPSVPLVAHRVVDGVRHARPVGLASSALMAFAMGAILYLGYIFLDASTRGHFTWSLRIVSVLTFAALCLAISVLRHGL